MNAAIHAVVGLASLLAACGTNGARASGNAKLASSPAAPEARDDHPPAAPALLVPPSADFDIVDLVLDAHNAYWAHRGERGIVRVALTGGEPVTLVPARDQPITSLAEDAAHLYFTTGRRIGQASAEELTGRSSPRFGHFEGVVARVRKDGAAPVEELSAGRFDPADVAVAGGDLYWVMLRKDETLVRLPPGTDSPGVVAHGKFAPGSLVVARGAAYWMDPDAGPAVMGVRLDAATPATSAGTSVPTKIALGPAGNPVHPLRLAADDAAIYWTDAGDAEEGGAIVRVPLGAEAPTLLAQGESSPRGIALSGGFVYWVDKGTSKNNFTDGSLKKVATTGGAVTTLAIGLRAPDRLAASATRVCWTEIDGSVKTMAR